MINISISDRARAIFALEQQRDAEKKELLKIEAEASEVFARLQQCRVKAMAKMEAIDEAIYSIWNHGGAA